MNFGFPIVISKKLRCFKILAIKAVGKPTKYVIPFAGLSGG